MKARIIAALLMIIAVGQPDIYVARQRQLENILAPLLQPGAMSESYQEDPGWYDPADRQALKNFIAENSDTEEAREAQVWLIFAQANTESARFSWEKKRLRSERAKKLREIVSKTTRPGTARMASLLRVYELFEAEEWVECEKQVQEIVAHIQEYQCDSNKQFRRLLTLMEMRRSEIEPEVRIMLAIGEIHRRDLGAALAQAEELKKDFPIWSRRERMDGAISMLKRGESPWY